MYALIEYVFQECGFIVLWSIHPISNRIIASRITRGHGNKCGGLKSCTMENTFCETGGMTVPVSHWKVPLDFTWL